MKRHVLLMAGLFGAAVLGAGSRAHASVVLFDDALQNGATLWTESGSSAIGSAPAGEPTAGASPSIKMTVGSWSQAGVRPNRAVTAPDTILEAQIYRVGGGDLHLRYGGSWTDITLNAANGDKWTLDGLPGTGTITANTWHTLRVDIAALGITTTLNALSVKAGGSSSVWYMDNVQLVSVPEPATIAAAGLGSLALLRRRRQA